jgi:hypothetical protein
LDDAAAGRHRRDSEQARVASCDSLSLTEHVISSLSF